MGGFRLAPFKVKRKLGSHYAERSVGRLCVCVCVFLLLFSTPPFLEGTQVSGRWRQDGTQREPGESLEGAPGSGSSQVLSWSTLDKKGAGLLHMLPIAAPNHNKVPVRTLAARRRHGRWTDGGVRDKPEKELPLPARELHCVKNWDGGAK